MKNLKIWQKLLLLAAVFTLPFLIVTATLLSTLKEQAGFARGELTGVDYAKPLLKLADDLRTHRALADRVIAGQPLQSQLEASNADLQADLRAVDAIYARPDGDAYGAQAWQSVRDGIRNLLEARSTGGADASFDRHGELIADTAGLVAQVGDVSQLILDPQLDSYYLMIALISEGPQLSEYLAQARVLAYPTPGGASAERVEKARGLAALTAAADERLGNSLARAVAADPSLAGGLNPRAQAVSAEVRQTRQAIARLSGAVDAPAGAPGATGIGASREGALLQLQSALAPALAASLAKRMNSYTHQLRNSFAVAALALLVVLVIGWYIVRSITRPLAQVVGVANQIAVGNLNVEPVGADRRDEIGTLARAFHRMITSLREQVLLVQDIADGDLTGSVKPQSANDDLGNALVGMVAHLSALVSEVHKSGIQVNTSRRRFPPPRASSIRPRPRSPPPPPRSVPLRRKSPPPPRKWCGRWPRWPWPPSSPPAWPTTASMA
ncbi:MAG: HAMP domain-containing protein [Arenimonas sp.]